MNDAIRIAELLHADPEFAAMSSQKQVSLLVIIASTITAHEMVDDGTPDEVILRLSSMLGRSMLAGMDALAEAAVAGRFNRPSPERN